MHIATQLLTRTWAAAALAVGWGLVAVSLLAAAAGMPVYH